MTSSDVARFLSKKRRQQAGVTLVEVLIVVAIMAMLAGGVAFAVLPRMASARLSTAKTGALEIRKVVELWQMDNGGECPSLSQLKKGKFIDKAGTTDDPWGKSYKIKCTDGEVYVSSSGPDGKNGTDDDITVPAESGSDGDDE